MRGARLETHKLDFRLRAPPSLSLVARRPWPSHRLLRHLHVSSPPAPSPFPFVAAAARSRLVYIRTLRSFLPSDLQRVRSRRRDAACPRAPAASFSDSPHLDQLGTAHPARLRTPSLRCRDTDPRCSRALRCARQARALATGFCAGIGPPGSHERRSAANAAAQRRHCR